MSRMNNEEGLGMTDEEMAEEYANENKIIFEYQGMSDFVWQELKEACLAGLKAGRPKWHKVADEYDCCMLASLDNGVWHNYHDIENVVAWCEVPKFSE